MKDPLLNLVQAHSFPEVAAALRARSARVLERWIAAVREVLPGADELTWTELRNTIPDGLERIAKALESTRAAPTRSLLLDSAEHGTCRFHQSYNLAELLVEYDLLRPILIEEVARHLDRQITLPEVMALSGGLDLAARQSVITFVQHQKQQIQTASDTQAKYLSFLAHDLRGGLNSILMIAELLGEDLAKEPRLAGSLKDLELMRRNIHDTVSTMNRFLQAEQLRSGKVPVDRADLDLRQLVQEFAEQFKQQAQAKRLELEAAVNGECVSNTDRELVMLVVQNLLSNAIKYTSRGRVTIASSTLPNKGCRISVIDQGPGIASDRLHELFTPFTRGETHGQPGVGLGLSIAWHAAQILGAKLHVDSVPGAGTTFHLDLPV